MVFQLGGDGVESVGGILPGQAQGAADMAVFVLSWDCVLHGQFAP